MEKFSANNIGNLIRSKRVQAGLTQSELSEIIGIDEKQIGKIERGLHYPSVPTFLKLLKALKIDIQEFYENDKTQDNRDKNVEKIVRLLKNFSEKELNLIYKITETVRKNY